MGRFTFNFTSCSRKKYFIFLLGIIFFYILINLNIYISELTRKFTLFIPNKLNLINEFNPANYENFSETRIGIMSFATKMIFDNPFLGWGAASFSYYNFLKTYIYTGHPHNLFLELAFSYGFLPSLLVFVYVVSLCLISLRIVYSRKKNNLVKIYFMKRLGGLLFLFLLTTQMIDIQYFDIRISLAFWILLAGMRSIIRENISYKLGLIVFFKLKIVICFSINITLLSINF